MNTHSAIDIPYCGVYNKDIEAYWEETYAYGMVDKTTFVSSLISVVSKLAKLPHQHFRSQFWHLTSH